MAAKIFGSHGSMFMYHLGIFALRRRYLSRSSLASNWEKYLTLKKHNRNSVSAWNKSKLRIKQRMHRYPARSLQIYTFSNAISHLVWYQSSLVRSFVVNTSGNCHKIRNVKPRHTNRKTNLLDIWCASVVVSNCEKSRLLQFYSLDLHSVPPSLFSDSFRPKYTRTYYLVTPLP